MMDTLRTKSAVTRVLILDRACKATADEDKEYVKHTKRWVMCVSLSWTHSISRVRVSEGDMSWSH